VIRASVAYLVVAWVVIEVTSVVFPAILLPDWAHRLVVILAGVGFPIVLVLAWAFDVSPDGITYTGESGADDKPGGSSDRAPSRVPPAADQATASICVLPFEVLSPSEEDRFIAQSVSAELCGALTRLPGVRVISRISARAIEEGLDARELGERYAARYVLAGSLNRRGDTIRLIVELSETDSGSRLWSETYQRPLDDIMQVEQDIAAAIAGAFGGERLRDQIRHAASEESGSATAWTLVHKARSYIINYSEDNLREAKSLAQQAIALSPNYAAAHAALADAIAERIVNGLSEDPDNELLEAIEAINFAVTKVPDDVLVLKLAGNVWKLAGEHDRAIDCLRRAVELSPFDAGAWGYLAGALATSDDETLLEEADTILNRILEFAPSHPGAGYWWHHKALVATARGDFDGAVTCVNKALRIQPGLSWAWYLKANALAAKGDEAGAREALARAGAANRNLSVDEYRSIVQKASVTEAAAGKRTSGLNFLGIDQPAS